MDYKIVIDPGHGGSDPGASGNGIIEKNLTLDISKYMYDRFNDLGIPVSITRSDDITLSPRERTDKILDFYGPDSNVIVISNHINAGGGDGAEVIYALRNGAELSNLVLSELSKEGQNIRKAYQRRLPSDNSKDYYFIHRDTGNTEPIIVEYGFLDSSKDDVNQLKNNYRNLAEAVVRGVLEYIDYDSQSLNNNIYVVKKGDSLWSIAKKYGTTVDLLKQINNLDNNLLSIGQTLRIPSDNINNNINDNINNDIYIVKAGDTLYSIASRYGISVSELKNYNNLDSDLISIGQQLYLPFCQISEEIIGVDYDTYDVISGDTLYSIAGRYGVTVNDLKQINNLTSDILSIGQRLLIPRDKEIVDTLITNYIDYRINPGDTLYGLANRYGITVNDLKQINNLNSNNLSVGQVIRIPSLQTTVYTVKPFDTLYSISRNYNIPIDVLRSLNNLDSDILSIGQVLKIN